LAVYAHQEEILGFRPFAPAVLREDAPEWFDLTSDSPYMLIIADVKKAKRRAMSR
jgi:carbamoyltransferase